MTERATDRTQLRTSTSESRYDVSKPRRSYPAVLARIRLWLRSALAAVLSAALVYSFVPLTIDSTIESGNPFIYNMVSRLAVVFILTIFLRASVRRIFGQGSKIRSVLDSTKNLLIFETEGRVHTASSWRDIIRLPLTWMVISSAHYAFFAWSSIHIEAAISTTILELWPIIMIIVLSTVMNSDASDSRYHISTKKLTFCLLAPLGLAFVIFSQTDSPSELLDTENSNQLFGVILAIVALILNGISPAASLYYGRLLNRHLGAKNESQHPDQPLWFTLLGFLAASVITVPLNFFLGLGLFEGDLAISNRGIWGAIVSGLLLGSGLTLLRRANHMTKDLSINGFFFLTPVLALVWLAAATISLPRIDLFVIGSTLVLSLNILIQVDPDEQRSAESPEDVQPDASESDDHTRNGDPNDTSESSDDRRWGIDESTDQLPGDEPSITSRFGFSALILAIWSSGTVIVLRDDILSQDWVLWRGPDYWGLVGLSATVFALIFGFRVARLASRINSEEELTLELYRRCEELSKTEKLPPTVLPGLRRLDVASPKHLSACYAFLSRRLEAGRKKAVSEGGDVEKITDLKVQLDKLAHSKQQGRDFAELISLIAFAIITVSLGLFARPSTLILPLAGWSGFLAESFSVLFVSTISFLAFNLFDLRRDRELPLFDPVLVSSDNSSLYFRRRQNLTMQRIIAVAICVFMAIAFAALLYGKWL